MRLLARVAGSLLLLVSFTTLGYSLWETRISGWVAEQAQEDLRTQFDASVQTAPTTTGTLEQVTPAPIEAAPPATTPLPPHGKLAGRILIPTIGVDQMVLAGTDPDTLENGPGLWEDGIYPGMPGNATVSGHRTTYGGPFRNLDQLHNGDTITFEALDGTRSVFEVRGTGIVSPAAVQVTGQGPGVRLTLTTCDPPGTAARRLVVQAELVEGPFKAQALPGAIWEFRGE